MVCGSINVSEKSKSPTAIYGTLQSGSESHPAFLFAIRVLERERGRSKITNTGSCRFCEDTPRHHRHMTDLREDKINDDITLLQSKNGLTFTTDAYLLSAFVRRPAGRFGSAVELGAGTGVISLLLAARNRADRIVAVEVQEHFYNIMQQNIVRNGYTDVITPVLGDVRAQNEQRLGGQFDAVFANPPYLRAGSGFENAHDEANIARREVYGGLSDFCAAAGRLCRHGGTFFVVYRPERMAELMNELHRCGFEPKQLTLLYADADSSPSLLFCAARRGGKPGGLIITPPLFVYERGTRTETETFRKIYETGRFPEEFMIK